MRPPRSASRPSRPRATTSRRRSATGGARPRSPRATAPCTAWSATRCSSSGATRAPSAPTSASSTSSPGSPPTPGSPTPASSRGDVAGARRALETAAGVAGYPGDAAFDVVPPRRARLEAGATSPRGGRLPHRRGLRAELGPPTARDSPGWRGRAATSISRSPARATWRPASPLAEHVIVLGDLLALAGQRERADEQYDVARAEAGLLRANGVDVDLELALFEADHGDPAAAVAPRGPSGGDAGPCTSPTRSRGRCTRSDRARGLAIAERALALGTRNACSCTTRG